MTVPRTHLDYLNDIVQAMEKIAEFIHGMDFIRLDKMTRRFTR